MSAEANHWYHIDREYEDRGAVIDARELAIEYRADAFRTHKCLWVDGELKDMSAAYELVWDSEAYAAHCAAKNEASTVAEMERLAGECDELIKRLLEVAIITIATLAVDKELEAA